MKANEPAYFYVHWLVHHLCLLTIQIVDAINCIFPRSVTAPNPSDRIK